MVSSPRPALLFFGLVFVACARGAAPASVTDVVLVHGAWADASSWSSVIAILQSKNLTVHAPQLCLRNVTEDVQTVKQAIADVGRPVVVAAHSFGGFISALATAGETNVTAVVYVAAYAPDKGETVLALATKFAPTPFFQNLVNRPDGFVTIQPDGFVKVFASGVKPALARVLSVVQRPTAGALFAYNATTPGWKTIPSYYQISKNDLVLSPVLQRFEAKRMKPVETLELASGHLSIVTHAKDVAGLILRAAAGGRKSN